MQIVKSFIVWIFIFANVINVSAQTLPDDGKKLLITSDFGSIAKCKTLADINEVARTMISAEPDVMTIKFASPDSVHYLSKIAHTNLNDTLQSMAEKGDDAYGHIVEQLQKGGVEVHGGMRMNDHHGQPEKWTEWQREHVEWSLGEDTGKRTWRAIGALRQMDYAVKGVREHRLAIIEEVLNWYPLDGIQLNFNRTAPFVSEPKKENGKYITEFIIETRKLLDEAAERRGVDSRSLKLGAIVPWDIDYCINEGLEVKRWIREGLVDYISPGEWHYVDFNIPFDEWAKLAAGTEVEIYPEAPGDVAPFRISGWSFQSGDMPLLENNFNLDGPKISAFSELAYSQGGDGVLLFNFYVYNFKRYYPKVPAWVNANKLKDLSRQYYYCRKLKYVPTEEYTFSKGSAFDRFHLNNEGDKFQYSFNLGTGLQNEIAVFRFKMKNMGENDSLRVKLNGSEVKPVYIDKFTYNSREKMLRNDKKYSVSIWQRPVGSEILNEGGNLVEVELLAEDSGRKSSVEVGEFELLIR